MTERTVVHLVPHTHWDREWYEPFQTFRMRLVELVDQLLERMALDPRLRFTLDGQAATIDDYLEVRPEAEPVLRRLITEGRLAIGPWQILMDEFLVSGETIVRNLELGWARAEGLGRAMPVGYLPDMFGHIAQMPQILSRAGIGQAALWRGVAASIDRNTFRWVAPDGSAVTTEYLVGGYGNGAYLFEVPDRLGDKLTAYVATQAAFYGTRSCLAMYGTDHAVPSPRLADLVAAVNRDHPLVEVRIETLADYAAGAPADEQGLRTWTGELRSGARANMLMGVSSARMDLKAASSRVERLLERYAEPLTALHGGTWPDRLLDLAWRRVVDNSAHDSICGCSHDSVGAQVLTRFAEAEQLGNGILAATGRRISAQVPSNGWAVLNPSPAPRTDLVTLEVPIADGERPALRADGRLVPVQEIPGGNPPVAQFRLLGEEIPAFLARRRHGRELFGRQMNSASITQGGEVPEICITVDVVAEPPELDVDELLEPVLAAAAAAPDTTWDLVVLARAQRRVLAWVAAPALSWSTLEAGEPSAEPPPAGTPEVVVTGHSLANGLVELTVEADGTVGLRGGGSELSGVGRLVDGGEFGDSYNYGPPARDRLVEAPHHVVVDRTHLGPLMGELVVRRRYHWPIEVEPNGAARSEATIETEVTTHLVLRAGEPFVRVEIEVDNRSRDHRLRWHLPLPLPATVSSAEGQFAVVERGLTPEGGHGEVPLPTYPARGFVHATGVSILLDQLTEYELVDGGRELAITVLRSFGLISRNANPYRQDPAGPEVPVPDAQRIGPWRFAFAVLPHAGGWSEAGVLEAAEHYHHPLLALRGTARAGTQDRRPPAGLTVDGPGVVFSALRRRGEWLELRLVAEHAAPTVAIVRGDFREARAVDLLGREGAPIPCSASLLRLPLKAWEIATVRLR